MMPEWFHYVRHADVPEFEKLGWQVAFPLGRPHGTYSVGMKWTGEGAPQVPTVKEHINIVHGRAE